MASYDAYLLATLLPPLLIIGTILLSSYCAWGVSYLVFTVQRRRAERDATDELIEYPGLQYMYTALQPVFGNRLHARKTRDRVKVKLHGEELSPGAIPLAAQLVALALGLSLAVFVTVLTVDIGQVCDEKLDCFPFNYSRQARPLTSEPIQNCSLYGSKDITIMCFSFTIRLVDALGSSGGVLALTTVGISYYVALLFTLAQIRCCRVTGLCGCLLLFLISCTILLSTLLWVVPLGSTQSATLRSVKNWQSILVYYYTIMYILLIATLLLCCVPRYRQDFGRCWNRKNRRYQAPSHDTDTEYEHSHELRATQDRSTGHSGSRDRTGSRMHQTSYYGTVDERSHVFSNDHVMNEATPLKHQQSSNHNHQSSDSERSGTITPSQTQTVKEGEQPIVYRTQSVHGQRSTRRISKRGNGHSLRKNKGEKGKGGSRGQGSHWADVTGGEEAEEEWSTTSGQLENGNKNNFSEGESSSGHSSQGEGRGGERGRGREQESDCIRAVLTGGATENRWGDGDTSVHTHL